MLKLITSGGFAAACLTASACAQDARTVTEPVIPPLCTTLTAQLTSVREGPYDSLAATDESKLDTDRIQSAIDGCGKGKAVALKTQGAANAFLTGPLSLRSGVTLLVDKGAMLLASLDPKVFDVTPGSCGIVKPGIKAACKPVVSVDGAHDAAIMGDGAIDGRGGVMIPGLNLSAWDIAERYQGKDRGLFRMVVANHADNFTLYRITIRNSQNFNVTYNGGDGFTVWGVRVEAPHRVPHSARPLSHNTDGIDPGNGSKNITVTHSYIRTGDDNIAIKGGKGGLTNMTVSHNHFYWGHGMSIGSETYGGVSKVRVFDLSLDGTDAGIRIKTTGERGGLVEDVRYENVCIRNSRNPIEISTHYAASTDGNSGSRPPTYRDITLKDVNISGGGQILFDGFAQDHRVGVTLDGVFLSDADKPGVKYVTNAGHADITIGKGGSNITPPTDKDSTLSGTLSKMPNGLPSCEARFVPYPE
ncbi:MAG: glycosyl hydrolase family 28 protein [Rhizomicrobium sp.]|nr:glycosyl hydrolase family 28 protein [Rhizomicrobium sp.]